MIICPKCQEEIGSMSMHYCPLIAEMPAKRLHPTAGSAIPEHVATCPECGGKLYFNTDYDTDPESDEPPGIDCENEPDLDDDEEDFHRFWQSDWQPVLDKISAHFRG